MEHAGRAFELLLHAWAAKGENFQTGHADPQPLQEKGIIAIGASEQE